MKRLCAYLLAIALVFTTVTPFSALAAESVESDDANQYVNLDGEWNFKLYRTYSRMFQYLPYNMVEITWEDNETALLPSVSDFSTWETVSMPYDDITTGGLLPLERETTEETESSAAASDTASVEEAVVSDAGVAEEVVAADDAAADETEATDDSADDEAAASNDDSAGEVTDEPAASDDGAADEAEPADDGTAGEAESAEIENDAEEEAEPFEDAAESADTNSDEAVPAEETGADAGEETQADVSADESDADAALVTASDTESEEEDTFDPMSVMLPSWSEAWVCRTFELPSDFTEEETVTLLLGIIDDLDVVYINGHLVAASGFMDGSGNATTAIAETGGFVYDSSVSAESQVKFEKSYWEVSREYEIPTEYLNLGGTNEICIRLYNNNGYGGFYSGNVYAICGNDTAVRAAKGLATETVDLDSFRQVIEQQVAAIESQNMDDYAATVYDAYNNDGVDKEGRVAEIAAVLDGYSNIQVTDEDVGYYVDDDGAYWYHAIRTITGVAADSDTAETIFSEDIEQCYTLIEDVMYERGNYSRCYTVTYDSTLFSTELTYSVYLPPSYYENTDQYYPVVYLLHGINSSSSSFINVDGIESFMDDLISSGQIIDMIVIMPDSGKNSFYRDTELDASNTDSTGPWQTHITTEIREEAESTYRILSDAKYRGLTGISMGGYGAMTIGTSFPELYSSIASHMGYLPEDALESLKSLSAEELANYDFYIDCGLQDTMVDYQGTVAIHEYLESMGIEHGYDLRDGGHNSAFYMASLDRSMIMHSEHFLKAMNAEGETVDTAALTAAIEKAETLTESDYTADSWAAMQAALETAKAVAANDSAAQTEVDEAAAALTSAIDALEEKVTVPAATEITSVVNKANGIKLTWDAVDNATSYQVYRKIGSGSWKKVKTTSSTSWTDTAATKNGTKYQYKVYAVNEAGKSKASATETIYRLTAKKFTRAKNVSSKKISLKWTRNTKATGYIIEYSTSSDFSGAKTVTVKGNKNVTTTLKNLTKGKKYYIRMRPYKTDRSVTSYAGWSKVKTVTIKK
ncbi:MAG: fibronectin type III domain-containing protein [Clostridiales bacterium]|nr:fibronectin type III domain-containing protein [Clostridiales bacterium]